jgi:BlaI family transcriptional regulator, penicillinase repressor
VRYIPHITALALCEGLHALCEGLLTPHRPRPAVSGSAGDLRSHRGEVGRPAPSAGDPIKEAIMAQFTKGELEVMRILWQHGEMKPAEIHQRFPRKITNPSLRSYLAILLEKGHITRRRVGKAYYYRARTRRESTFRSMLRDLTRVCCDGSVQALLCQLIRSEKLSEEDLLDLKRIADQTPHRSEPPDPEEKP